MTLAMAAALATPQVACAAANAAKLAKATKPCRGSNCARQKDDGGKDRSLSGESQATSSVPTEPGEKKELPKKIPGRHALVIGNEKYAVAPLANPGRDATDVAAALEELGFEVQVIRDATLTELAKGVNKYVAQLHHDDLSFVFYAGHGLQVKGENFIVPTDFEPTQESDVPYTTYPADRLLDGLAEASLKLSIVVLDACRDNPFRTNRDGRRGLTLMNAGKATLIAFATGPGQTTADGEPGKNGLYTTSLLKFIRQPGVEVEPLFKLIREDVAVRTKNTQVPWVSSNVLGEHFLRPPIPGMKPLAPPLISHEARLAWRNGGFWTAIAGGVLVASALVLGASAQLENQALRTTSSRLPIQPRVDGINQRWTAGVVLATGGLIAGGAGITLMVVF